MIRAQIEIDSISIPLRVLDIELPVLPREGEYFDIWSFYPEDETIKEANYLWKVEMITWKRDLNGEIIPEITLTEVN